MDGCLVISNQAFPMQRLGENHPIDFQPFINGWLQGVPGTKHEI